MLALTAVNDSTPGTVPTSHPLNAAKTFSNVQIGSITPEPIHSQQEKPLHSLQRTSPTVLVRKLRHENICNHWPSIQILGEHFLPERHDKASYKEVCHGQGHDKHVGDSPQPLFHHRANKDYCISQECDQVNEGEYEPDGHLLEADPCPSASSFHKGWCRREIREPRLIFVHQHLPTVKSWKREKGGNINTSTHGKRKYRKHLCFVGFKKNPRTLLCLCHHHPMVSSSEVSDTTCHAGWSSSWPLQALLWRTSEECWEQRELKQATESQMKAALLSPTQQQAIPTTCILGINSCYPQTRWDC